MRLAASNVAADVQGQRWWQCDRKRHYDTERAAMRAAAGTQRAYAKVYHAYHCEYCGKFHVGRVNWKRKNTMRKGE